MDKLINNVEYFNSYDILSSETWFKPNHPYNMNLRGYTSLCLSWSCTNKKAKRGSGDLMCYIRNEIKEGIEYLNSSCNNLSAGWLWIKLRASYFGFDRLVYVPRVCYPRNFNTPVLQKQCMEYFGRRDCNLLDYWTHLVDWTFQCLHRLTAYVNHDSALYITLQLWQRTIRPMHC